MKILGLTCGRKMGNSETLLKEALMGAEEVNGAEVEIIRLYELFIKPCTGCESCTKQMMSKKKIEDVKCILKDDHMPFLHEKLAECEGVILSSPIYSMTPPGFLMMIRDRLTRLHHFPNPSISAFIAVGGSDWVNFALSMMYLCLPHRARVIDQMLLPFTPRPSQKHSM